MRKKIQRVQELKTAVISDSQKTAVEFTATESVNEVLDAVVDYAEYKIKENNAEQKQNQSPEKDNESPWYVPWGMQRLLPASWGEKYWLLDW